jgi:hypothetical protein
MFNFLFKKRRAGDLTVTNKEVRNEPLSEKSQVSKPRKVIENTPPASSAEEIIQSAIPAEEKIRHLKKLATQLKKKDWGQAADTLASALEIAKAHRLFQGAETELRFANYLYNAGRKDQAFKEIARITTYGVMFETDPTPPSKRYGTIAQCLQSRCGLLEREGSKESLSQLIFDAALADHCQVLVYSEILENWESRELRSPSYEKRASENLQFQLRMSESEDMNKFGLNALEDIGLGHLKNEYLTVIRQYAKDPRRLDFAVLEEWLRQYVNQN